MYSEGASCYQLIPLSLSTMYEIIVLKVIWKDMCLSDGFYEDV